MEILWTSHPPAAPLSTVSRTGGPKRRPRRSDVYADSRKNTGSQTSTGRTSRAASAPVDKPKIGGWGSKILKSTENPVLAPARARGGFVPDRGVRHDLSRET